MRLDGFRVTEVTAISFQLSAFSYQLNTFTRLLSIRS